MSDAFYTIDPDEVPKAVAWCWHPDCLDPSRDDALRLNVRPRPEPFLSDEELREHAAKAHGITFGGTTETGASGE